MIIIEYLFDLSDIHADLFIREERIVLTDPGDDLRLFTGKACPERPGQSMACLIPKSNNSKR